MLLARSKQSWLGGDSLGHSHGGGSGDGSERNNNEDRDDCHNSHHHSRSHNRCTSPAFDFSLDSITCVQHAGY